MNYENYQLEEEVSQLIKLAKNIKKSINNKNKRETLIIKLKYAEDLNQNIHLTLRESEIEVPLVTLEFIIKNSREAIDTIRSVIRTKLENTDKRKTDIQATMAVVNPAPFNVKTATALMWPYDGASIGIEAFVDSLILLAELTPQAQVATAIKFIKTRLSGKARAALPAEPVTIQEIIEAVKQSCKGNESADRVLAQWKAITNKADKNKFCDEVDTLTQKLTTLYVGDQIPQPTRCTTPNSELY